MDDYTLSRQNRGFTLTEIMITIALIAVITSIAVPSYRDQTIRANRTEAVDELLRQAAFQQREYTLNSRYTAVDNYRTANGYYRIRTLIDDDGQGFRIRAIPRQAQGQREDGCGRLEINNIGQRTARTGDNAQCWSGGRS